MNDYYKTVIGLINWLHPAYVREAGWGMYRGYIICRHHDRAHIVRMLEFPPANGRDYFCGEINKLGKPLLLDLLREIDDNG